MDRRNLLRGAAGATGLWMTGPVAGAAATPRTVTVDAGRAGTVIRPLMGVAGVPGPTPQHPKFADMAASWTRGRVRMVRSHDWVARLDTIDNPDSLFPRWDADPTDPASYNFAAADLWVDAVRNAGAEVLFTIASAIPRNKLPARDLAKYERVVEHIVRHYVGGWGNGREQAVRCWEFGDQPDFGKLHFAGTPGEFHAMYAAFARAVKRVDPRLKAGGPGLAFPLNADIGHRESFLAFVRAQALPLDFFSYNWFSDATRDPLDQRVVAQRLRAVLDAHGFAQTELVADSWNYLGIPTSHAPAAETAAYIAAAGIYLVDSPLDRACYFRADSGWDPHYGFMDPAGYGDGEGKSDPRRLAVEALGQALAGRRLPVTGGDDQGFAALASRDETGGVVRVLVTNHVRPAAALAPRAADVLQFRVPLGAERVLMTMQLPPQRPAPRLPPPQSVRVLLRGLPAGPRGLIVSRRVVGPGGSALDSIAVPPRRGLLAFDVPLEPSSFALFEIRAA